MIGTSKEVLPWRLTAPILVIQLVTTLYHLIRLVSSVKRGCCFGKITLLVSNTLAKNETEK